MPAKQGISTEIANSLPANSSPRTLRELRKQAQRQIAFRKYSMRLAQTADEKAQAFRLRFLVFNIELQEGLESAFATGYDTDQFDDVCDHLIVEHHATGRVIATYRMQTGANAAAKIGYYSQQEFNFAPFEPIRNSLVEVGRAAILKEHRTFEVLNLLWKGIAKYTTEHHGRYLVGCSSLTSQDPAEGHELYRQLEPFLASPELRTKPQSGFALPENVQPRNAGAVTAPKLLRAYLNLGARICGEPALDREFKTIDFLTLLDLENLSQVARARFFDAP